MKCFVTRRAACAEKILLVALAALIGLAACPACPEDEVADIRAIHLSPDAPAVDVWVRAPDTQLFSNLSFTDSSTYSVVDEGTYTLEIVPAGALIDESVLTVDDVDLQEDTAYTAAVVGPLDDLSPILMADEVTTPPVGQFRLRVVHAAFDVGEVDVWDITDPEEPAALVENLSFSQFSDYLLIEEGAYVVGIDVDGDEQPDLVFELPELPAGAVINLYALQDEAGEVFLLAQLLDGSTVRVDARPILPELDENEAGVRFVHLSPDAPPVDIWGPTTPVVTELVFGEGTDHLAVPFDIDLIEIVPAGAEREEAVLVIEPPVLEAGEYYTAVVYNELEDILALLLLDDLSPTIPGAVRFRPIHVGVGVGDVDIWAARPNEPPVLAFEDLVFGEAAEYIEVPAGQYSIGLDVGRDDLIDVTAPLGAVTAATVANIFAVVDAEGAVFFLVQENGRHTRVDADIQDPPLLPGDVLPLTD